jgi:flavin-binding protein dodecin
MTPGEVAEIRGSSSTSFEDAITRGLAGVNRTLQSVRCMWLKRRDVRITEGHVREYQVDMLITFIGDDWQAQAS